MPIKVSQIIKSNIRVQYDTAPVLSGSLFTNNFSIQNGTNPVTISGNNYPITNGIAGQILTSDGAGNIVFTTNTSTQLKLYSENYSSPVAPQALGANSIALGDASTTGVTAYDSLAIGAQSLTRLPGSVMQANGRFASTGDAQTGRYLLRTHTINNVPTELFIDGTSGSIRLTLPDDSTWTFRVTIAAHRTDSNDGHAGYIFNGVVYRGAGAVTVHIQGSIQKTILSESNSVWDANISADTTTGSLKISVLGETGKTIRWVALVETVEITN